MAASVSHVERFERVDVASGRDVASEENDSDFKDILRIDHLDFEEPTRQEGIRFG
jgi:hypothetical protein